MRTSFDQLWEAMEARRQRVEAGERSPASRGEKTRQAQRTSQGCPDAEALCGWVDGELRRKSLRRWLAVWHHVRIRQCRACQAEIITLTEASPPDRPRSPWFASAMKGIIAPLQMAKTSLVWASSIVLIAVSLSLWSFGPQGTFHVGMEQSGAPAMEETGTPVGDEPALEAPPEPVIWGD